MSQPRLIQGVIALAVAAFALATAALAAAAPGAGIQVTQVGRLPFPERGYVIDLPQSAAVAAKQVHVVENGIGVGDFTFSAVAGSGLRYGAILVIDTSDSMAGAPERAAFAAARTFVSKRNPDELVGVMTVDGTTTVIQKPTTDSGALNKALANQPRLAYGTHLYDALGAAFALLAREKIAAGSVVLLSDGADVGSTSTLAAVARTATQQHVRVFTVGLHDTSFDGSTLKAVATGTGGTYAEATEAQLRPLYAALSTKLSNEYLLEYRSASAPKSHVDVSITVDGFGAGSASYTAPTPSGLPPYHESFFRRFVLSGWSLLVVAVIAAYLVAFGLRMLFESTRTHLVERIGEFAGAAPHEVSKGEQAAEEWRRRARRARVTSSRFAHRWLTRIEEQLDIGRIPITAWRLCWMTAVSTVIIVWIIAQISSVFAVAGFATPLVVRALVRRKVRRVRAAFADQLPPNLQVLAAALRAGHTLIGALATTVDNADEPSRSELHRVLADEQLGVPLEDAIRRAARRMESRDLEQVALLAELQRSAGGNAAEVLDVIVGTVRERADIRRLVQTLTAQGRMARWILTCLPIATALAFWALQPDIVGGMWRSHGGQIAMLIAGGMVAAGSAVIQRIIDIEV